MTVSIRSDRLTLPLWHERYAAPFAPTTAAEMRDRGWDAVDVVFVTGDAYIDHYSFAMAITVPGSSRTSVPSVSANARSSS